MVIIITTIEEGKSGLGINIKRVSDPAIETDMEIAFAKIYNLAAKTCELLAMRALNQGESTIIEGNDIEPLATELMKKSGLVNHLSELKNSRFGR